MLYSGGTDMNRSSCGNTIDSMLGVNALKLPKLSLIRGSAMIIALLACLATPVLAADGDIAGPGHKGTIQQSGGSTFEYENADSGQGKFTMGQSDTSLTAEYDAIYYRVIFDGTPNIGNPTTTKNAEINQSEYYLDQDVTAFNNLMASQGQGSPAYDSEGTKYTLRYDETYKLPSNDTFSIENLERDYKLKIYTEQFKFNKKIDLLKFKINKNNYYDAKRIKVSIEESEIDRFVNGFRIFG